MTRIHSFAFGAALLSLVLTSSGCRQRQSQDQTVTVSIGPTAPSESPPAPTVTSVVIQPSGTINLTRSNQGGECVATQLFTATVNGTGSYYNSVTWHWSPTSGAYIASDGDLRGQFRATSNGTYTVYASSGGQGYVQSNSVTVIVTGNCDGAAPAPPAPPAPPTPSGPPTVTLNANPTSITQGQSTTLTWTSTNATSCSAADGWSGGKALAGSELATPSQTTTFRLTCIGPGGSATGTALVSVTVPGGGGPSPSAAPTATLTANPSSIPSGGSSTLTWVCGNSTSATGSGGWSGALALSGTRTVVLSSTTTFILTCSGPGGSATASATVSVAASACSISSINYSPGGGTIHVGQNLTLASDAPAGCQPFWYLSDPSRARVNGTGGNVVINGQTYTTGTQANLVGVFPGTITVSVQSNIPSTTPFKTYTWTVVP